jgi:hypothetical protein
MPRRDRGVRETGKTARFAMNDPQRASEQSPNATPLGRHGRNDLGICRESSARRTLRCWLVEQKSGIARGGCGNEGLHHLLTVTTLNRNPRP